MPRLECVEDSEEELEHLDASPTLTDVIPPIEALPLGDMAAATMTSPVDIFDIASTCMDRELVTYGKKGRRRSELATKRAPGPDIKGRRSQTSLASSTTTQRAKEDVLMVDFDGHDNTGDTIRVASDERDAMLQQVQAAVERVDHIEPTAEARSSASVPWSAGPITTPIIDEGAKQRRTQSTQSSMSTKSAKKRTSQPESAEQHLQQAHSPDARPQDNQAATERLIGLPAEQYKPRPSRSRSAQVSEPQIDWSAAPEKKSKSKKRRAESVLEGSQAKKREQAAQDALAAELLARARRAREEDSSAVRTNSTKTSCDDKVLDKEDVVDDTVEGIHTSEVEAAHNGDGATHATKLAQVEEQGASTTYSQPSLATPMPKMQAVVEISIPAPSSAEFATPGLPASATASLSRKKAKSRCHTTIFEDHVGLSERPDASPNLRQQQAQRKRGRPRKSAGGQGEVDDSVALPLEEDVESPVVKKKGRPRKTPAKEPTPEPVVEDHIVEEPAVAEQLAEPDAVAVEEESLFVDVPAIPPPPTDKGADKEAENRNASATPSPPQVPSDKGSIGQGKAHDDDCSKGDKDAAAAPGQIMHSPIKKSGTTFRVGLSKRQRIQPLLRMLKR